MAISPLHSLGEGDMAHITQQLSRKQGQVGYIMGYLSYIFVKAMECAHHGFQLL